MATSYAVDQTPQLDDLPGIPRPAVADDAPPHGSFRTFQVPIRDVAALAGLDLDQLAAVGRMPIAAALLTARVTSTWRELHAPEDLDLDSTWASKGTAADDLSVCYRCRMLKKPFGSSAPSRTC